MTLRMLVVSCVSSTIGLCGVVASADTIKTVNCSTGADLQRAIDQAAGGAVLQLTGDCARGPYFIFKDLTLIGVGQTVLSAPTGDRVLHVGGAKVSLQHININGIGSVYGLIVEERGSAALDDVHIDGATATGLLIQLTSYASVVNSQFTHSGIGVNVLSSSSAWIVDSEATSNAAYGIQARTSSSIQLINTRMSQGSAGLVIDESSSAEISGATIQQNTGPGLWVPHSAFARFTANLPVTIENNGTDIVCGHYGNVLFDAPITSSTKTTALDPACYVENAPFTP